MPFKPIPICYLSLFFFLNTMSWNKSWNKFFIAFDEVCAHVYFLCHIIPQYGGRRLSKSENAHNCTITICVKLNHKQSINAFKDNKEPCWVSLHHSPSQHHTHAHTHTHDRITALADVPLNTQVHQRPIITIILPGNRGSSITTTALTRRKDTTLCQHQSCIITRQQS